MHTSPGELAQALKQEGYMIDLETATTLFLGLYLKKPCLIEGPAGVGKTHLAIALAKAERRKLIRLQCYEGLDITKALYDWNYAKQLLRLQLAKTDDWEKIKLNLFSEEFLLARPLLESIRSEEPVLLLIDELDKSDEEFESFLLELLAEQQVTIPELGTITSKANPIVILTSNNSRDFSDALRRRCIHIYLTYPTLEREMSILSSQVPDLTEQLVQEVCEFVAKVRKLPLQKLPSVSESIDFACALKALQKDKVNYSNLMGLLNVLLKYPKDIVKLEERLKKWDSELKVRMD
ncbi:ATPase family associated with various cellular activities (AAA) [Desulfosporosinus acididurans]|uniref:ATPase family associated with various cellular activities (AAA) n=1 Tax=Desulfosporosinus acididurans TaxID=476652 RepID=A0A0J1FPE1_9FIRM|nr:MoxR family ATPase [Desulfosporosinus acididurans]KLU65187.1 ATPase family associated with various cellular activities (AAA) [Desulfosporosinus acididurans]